MTRFEKLFALMHGRQYCEHKWAILQAGPIVSKDRDPIGFYYTLQCEKCGDIKRKNWTT